MSHGTPDHASSPRPPPPPEDSRGGGGPVLEHSTRRRGAGVPEAPPPPEAAEGGPMSAPAKQPLTLAAIPADTRCLIYTRVSTEDQATEDRASLAVQERECRAFAAAHGFRDAVLWPPDHESGRSTARLERLAQWGEAHPRPANARGLVVVLKADRWGRFVHDEHASAYY